MNGRKTMHTNWYEAEHNARAQYEDRLRESAQERVRRTVKRQERQQTTASGATDRLRRVAQVVVHRWSAWFGGRAAAIYEDS
ncbi:MAG: hypothetical protein NVS2B7_18580 [Herpetosiphon sp.]